MTWFLILTICLPSEKPGTVCDRQVIGIYETKYQCQKLKRPLVETVESEIPDAIYADASCQRGTAM